MYHQSSSEWVLQFRTYNARCRFLPNIKLEQLQITVSKQSGGFSRTNNIYQLQITVSKPSGGFSKTNKFVKSGFTAIV